MASRFRSNGRRTAVRTDKRQNLWLRSSVDATTIAASSSTLLTVLNAAALLRRPFTIIRTHLVIQIESDQESAAERFFGAYGRMVVRDSASGVGITAVPTPGTDTDADWYTWQGLIARQDFVTGVGFDQYNRQYTIDSKALK